MKIRHRIVFDKETVSQTFLIFLQEKKAQFDKSKSNIGVAYICEEDDWKEELYKFLQMEQITSIVDAIYSKEEYDKAEWFSIRSKFRFEYPQPDDSFGYKSYTYDNEKYCIECGCGLRQRDNFRVNKSPKWMKRHFLMLNWVHDELFVSSIARDCLNGNRITGLKFLDVISHKKNTVFEDFYQIYVENELAPGLINLNQSVKEVRNCSICDNTKYIYSGKGLTFRKEIFENLNFDIFRTHESFGDGHICARKIIISRKLYQAIKNGNLDKDLEFEPIVLD